MLYKWGTWSRKGNIKANGNNIHGDRNNRSKHRCEEENYKFGWEQKVREGLIKKATLELGFEE